MRQILVRNAKAADTLSIADLSTQLGYPGGSKEICQRTALVIGQPNNAVLVADVSGRVVGWVHVFGAYRVESSPFAEIGGLVVNQTHRGSGIGRALVKAAIAWAVQRGFQLIRVRSNVTRQEAHDFYHRLGFSTTKSQVIFSMPLRGL